jgi:hypothetical protein
MIVLDDWEEIQRRVATARSRADRAAGALAQLKKQLRREFGCKTIDEAKAKYKEMLAEEHEATTRWNRNLNTFKKKWAAQLEGDNENHDLV